MQNEKKIEILENNSKILIHMFTAPRYERNSTPKMYNAQLTTSNKQTDKFNHKEADLLNFGQSMH